MLMPGLDDLPVVQVSLPQSKGNWRETSRTALEVGRALSPLRDKGVLIIGSGQSTSTHRAREDAEEFVRTLISMCTSLDFSSRTGDLENWKRSLPYAREVHSLGEHLLPLLVALGAAENELGILESDLWEGSLGVTHFRFGGAMPEQSANAASSGSGASPLSKVSSHMKPPTPQYNRSHSARRHATG
jgi:aromatic ring-opening dioxygenase catalytic subunit (LigB family)